MSTTHHYEPPVAYHYHNTPCKVCGKTARHANHRNVPVAAGDDYEGCDDCMTYPCSCDVEPEVL